MTSPIRYLQTLEGPSIIAFEGLNGAGKTELARSVAKALHLPCFQTPAEELRSARTYFDDDPFSAAAQLFYVSTAVKLSEALRAERGLRFAVCDRYISATLSYLAAAQAPLLVDLELVPLLPVAATVIVTVDEESRIRRLASRGALRTIDKASLDTHFRDRVLASLRELPNTLEVDTTRLPLETTSAHVATSLARQLALD